MAWTAAAALIACAIGAGCVLVTGSTSGYQQADAGAQSALDATCTADGGCLELSCLGASECGDAGVCCLTVSGNTLLSSCQAACQISQLCTSSDECSKGTCAARMCISGGVGVQFQSCGPIPGCN